jgi:cobalt-zinc-cadmium resistance protein CzcA
MLNAIIKWSLRHRFLVIAGAALFVLAALLSLPNLAIDAFPDTTPVQVQVNTTAPGMAPVDVERLVTFPVEQAISGLPRLQALRSLSKFGLSQVTVTFEDGTDIYFARQVLSERLNSVELPANLSRPRLGPVATGLGEVFHYTVSGPGHSLTELRTIQDWMIRPALRTVPGTAEINSWGGGNKQYQVRFDPSRLLKYDLTFDQVQEALRSNNLNVGGSTIQRAGAAYLVQGVGQLQTEEQIRDIVVATPRQGIPVRIRDVAEVTVGHDVRMGGVTAEGRGEVVLGLGFILIGENPHQVTTRLKAKLEEVKKTLPAGVKVQTVYDRTELVDKVIDTVRRNLFEGGLLVIAVLFIFLGNLRAGLIVATAIPFSMLFAFTGMLRYGIAGSLLSLGALDFGLVVDSSVVMVENCVRHLAHDQNRDKDHLNTVEDAAIEVRTPTMFGELIIMIVYLPILTLEGVAGKLFRPMALTVIFALLGSLVLSLTLMPVLASLLLPRRMEDRDPWVVRLAMRVYDPLLRRALKHGGAVLGVMALVLFGGVYVALNLGGEFVPRLSEGALVVGILRLPGTDLDESLRYNQRMEQLLLAAFPDEVEHVWSRTGTAEVATDPMGTEETDFFIALKPRARWTKARDQAHLTEQIEELFKDLPGQKLDYTQPIEQRVQEMTAGVRGDVAVKIFGDDFGVLKEKADEVAAILKEAGCDGDPKVEQLTGQPLLRIKVNQDQLARYGVTARQVLELVESLGGRPVGDVVEDPLRFPLVVRLPERLRNDPAQIRTMTVLTPSGERVPLSRLAAVETMEGPSKVLREWGRRRISVTCNVRDRDLAGFVREARQKVAERVKLPTGRYAIEWGGQFETMEQTWARLRLVVPIALALIFGLLYLTYNRLGDVLLVFTAVPFASVGGVVALWLRGLDLSISAGVGFIALSGVSVLNSMVLVTFIRQLRTHGVPLDVAIEEAALTRLRPVLMTALVASLGFLPMALSTGVGAEVQRPLATVVIGGVVSSTLLTLLVLPVLYHFFGPRGQSNEAPSALKPVRRDEKVLVRQA